MFWYDVLTVIDIISCFAVVLAFPTMIFGGDLRTATCMLGMGIAAHIFIREYKTDFFIIPTDIDLQDKDDSDDSKKDPKDPPTAI